MDVTLIDNLLFMIPIAGLVALVFGIYLFRSIFSKDTGSDEMREISDAIKDGAMAYLSRQYRTIGIICVILTPVLGLAINWLVAAAFLIGAFFSALSGFIGMYVSVNANIRTASAARNSLKEAFTTSFRGGAISGIAVASLSLLGVFALIMLFDVNNGIEFALEHIVGYAFGASLVALFAQLGGGIYTKAADVGADLVGKVEAGIPEDDPRNPAVIADLVGDNVGDCAGRGADIFESTAAEIIGSMIIGFAAYKVVTDPLGLNLDSVEALAFVFFPLVLMAFGLIASMIGISLVSLKNEDDSLHSALNLGYFVTAGLSFMALVFVANQLLGEAWLYFVGSGAIGIILGITIVYITQYYTSGDWRPVKEIAKASETGPATNFISGFAMGLESTVLPVIAISLTLVGSFILGQMAGDAMGLTSDAHLFVFGLYGTAVATIAMLTSAAFILAEDTFGPIADNAGGIVEMNHQPEEIRYTTDHLDSAGNTTKALTKG